MKGRIITPQANDWVQTLRKLQAEGTISSEQLELSLQRIERTGSVGDSMAGHFGETFICPVCRKYHTTTERGSIKKKWCFGCEDELIGDMM